MRFKTRHLLLLTAIISVILSVAVAIQSAIKTRLVVNIDHPNGTRLRVVQKFEYSGDLFDTSIYFDDGDGQWRWYYYDHEDWFWGSADTNINGSVIAVSADKRSIVFDTKTGECTVSQLDGDIRIQEKSDVIRTLPSELTTNSEHS